MADGTKFEIDIDVPADSAETAAASLARLGDQLTSAGAAAQAAADAVKSGEAAYASAERAADGAAKALEKLNVAAEAQAGKLQAALDVGDVKGAERAAAKLTALTIRQGEAAAKSRAAKLALDSQAASLDRLKVASGAAGEAQKKLAASHSAAKKSAEAIAKAQEAAAGSGKVNEMAEAFGSLGGPLGTLGQRGFGAADALGKLKSSMGSAGIYGAIALAVVGLATAFATLTAAALAGVAAITKWAVGLSDANRSARLLSDGIAGSVAGGRELDKAIKSLGARVPQTSDELRSMAADLAKSGLKGQALSDALEDAAVKAARLKWGPDFEKETKSLDNQARRLKENISGVFGGLKIDRLLDGVSKLVALFDETSITGKAIKVVFESLFQPLVDGLADLAPKMVSAFIQFQIWVLKALIAIKPFGSTILSVAKAFGMLAAVVAVMSAGFAVAVIAPFAILAGLMTAGVLLIQQAAAGFYALGVAIVSGAGSAIAWITEKFNAIVAFLHGLSLSEIGSQLIAGLAQGIMGGGAAVLSSITGVVGGAIDAAKGLLGIASPSKVFAEIGANTAEGMAGGVEASTSAVQGSLESMVSPPEAQASGGEAAAATGGGGGGLNLSGATFVFNGVEGAEDAEAKFGALLTRLLEGDAAGLGAEVPA